MKPLAIGTSSTGDEGSILGWEAKIPHAEGELSPCATVKTQHSQNFEKRRWKERKLWLSNLCISPWNSLEQIESPRKLSAKTCLVIKSVQLGDLPFYFLEFLLYTDPYRATLIYIPTYVICECKSPSQRLHLKDMEVRVYDCTSSVRQAKMVVGGDEVEKE